MAVAYEFGVFCKDDMRKAFEDSLPPMPRKTKRQEVDAYVKGWNRLEQLMKQFANINESANPEWFDEVVNKLTEAVNEVRVEIKE
jgi:hypothetical protein